MKRDELLAVLETARARLDGALDGLEPDELTVPGPVGEWSVKDVLAHITAWDVDLLTNLGNFKRGQKPGRTAWDSSGIQAQNTAWYAELQDRPLERVVADFDGVHEQLLRQVRGLTDAELEAPADWLQGRPLFQYFVDHVVTHENEHAAELARWRSERPAL
jgi:uncharacterized protein (TIGR03083 family)